MLHQAAVKQSPLGSHGVFFVTEVLAVCGLLQRSPQSNLFGQTPRSVTPENPLHGVTEDESFIKGRTLPTTTRPGWTQGPSAEWQPRTNISVGE